MIAKKPMLGPRFALCALAALAAGCASQEESASGADFGNSVRHMIALQTASPGYAGTGLDGAKAAAVMKAYETEVAKPKDVDKPMTFKVSQ
jgi:hypothetical protein